MNDAANRLKSLAGAVASMRWAWAWLGLLVLAPAAAAAPATLYAHLWSGYADFPINTQAPDDGYAIDAEPSLGTATLSCLPNPAAAAQPFREFHTVHGYPSPALVDYSTLSPGGMPRIHPERGLAGDVRLDASAPAVLHWYWAQEANASAPASLAAPPVVPNVVVEAELRGGDALSADDEAYDSGPLLAHGASAPATLAGPLSTGVRVDRVGGRDVYEFTVPLAIDQPLLPHATGYNLRVSTHVDLPCGDGHVMPTGLELHSSPGHRPRLELGVDPPVHVEAFQPLWVNGTLLLRTSLLDSWGDYDVRSVAATISGPGLPPTMMGQLATAQPTFHCHCYGHNPSAFRGFAIDLPHAQGGRYDVAFNVTTVAGTTTVLPVSFTWDPPARDAPALPAPLLLAGLAAVALVLRRRP